MMLSRRALGGGAAAAALTTPRRSRAASSPAPAPPLPLVLGTCCPCELTAGTGDELLDLDDAALDALLLGGAADGSVDTAQQSAVCDLTYAQVLAGARAGFVAFDTAAHYENEESVGAALRQAATEGVLDEKSEVISKVWVDRLSFDGVLQSAERSAMRVGARSNGVSLTLLLHFPGDPLAALAAPEASRRARKDAWRGMERCLDDGLVDRIGVANFSVRHMNELLGFAKILPAVNQAEFHPYCAQEALLKVCKEAGVEVQAASPFAHGELGLLRDERLARMASPRGISVAQLCLAWLLERGIRPMVGASSKAHIEEALLTPQVALPLALSEQEAAIIRALDRDVHAGFNPNDIP